MTDLKENLNRLLTLPAEPEARPLKLATIREVAGVGLNLVMLLAVSALLTLNTQSLTNYVLNGTILCSWFLLGRK
jgi:hypothetical protein